MTQETVKDEKSVIKMGGGYSLTVRNSNLELYRIIVMLLIVAHHYVVNSGLLTVMYQNPFALKSVFLFLFGAWGKTGINCFVLITGYFMCKSQITPRKFFKLLFEIEFYKIIFFLIFTVSGYQAFTFTGLIKAILPVKHVATDFGSCYLLFYLCIPFLNILVKNMNEKQHILLLALLGVIYVFFGTVPKLSVTMNYVSWFICLYFIGSYIRIYPKKTFEKTKLWGWVTLGLILISCLSVAACLWLGQKLGTQIAYYFVSDSNTFLAVCLGVASFLFFKNLKIKQSKFINLVAASTFGVLLIHANSDVMRSWLWGTLLNNVGAYSSDWIYLHAIASVIGVFIVAVIIDVIRSKTIEKPFLNFVEKGWNSFINKIKNKEKN